MESPSHDSTPGGGTLLPQGPSPRESAADDGTIVCKPLPQETYKTELGTLAGCTQVSKGNSRSNVSMSDRKTTCQQRPPCSQLSMSGDKTTRTQQSRGLQASTSDGGTKISQQPSKTQGSATNR